MYFKCIKLVIFISSLLYLSIFCFSYFGVHKHFTPMSSSASSVSGTSKPPFFLPSSPQKSIVQNIMTCSTSKGNFSVKLFPDKCPNSVKQLRLLEESGFLSQTLAFWRVNQWITQFGVDQSPTGRHKRNLTDPFTSVRKSFINDPHPICLKFGLHNASMCKQSTSEVMKAARRNETWKRGTFAVIGSTALIVVIGGNSQMGIAGHDCPVGEVMGDGMERVFDNLYSDYGNAIDTKSGPDQRDIFREGMAFIKREYPLVDTLNSCSFQ